MLVGTSCCFQKGLWCFCGTVGSEVRQERISNKCTCLNPESIVWQKSQTPFWKRHDVPTKIGWMQSVCDMIRVFFRQVRISNIFATPVMYLSNFWTNSPTEKPNPFLETARRADQDRLCWSARPAVSRKAFGVSVGLSVQKLDIATWFVCFLKPESCRKHFAPSLSWSAHRAVSKKSFGVSVGLSVPKLDRYEFQIFLKHPV